jgi:hypothetical protein
MINGHHHPYVQAAIDGEIGSLASAVEGTRNDSLFRSTAKLASLGLHEGEILRHLKPVAEQIGLRGSELYTTIKSGVKSGSSRLRQISNKNCRESLPASPPRSAPEAPKATDVAGPTFIARAEGPPSSLSD